MCDTKLSTIWLKACENYKIPNETATHWLNAIKSKYNTESHRIYHNLNILEKKCDFLLTLGASITYKNCLIFALCFQYYEFNLKTECSDANCKAFQDFYNESGIDDVSFLLVKFKYFLFYFS